MIIPVNNLPSRFKPYPFKSFKLKAISVKQALELGPSPSLEDITKLIQELAGDEIDASLLVPIDLKFLVATLAFQAYPNQSWTLNLACPHCGKPFKKAVTIKDFPPVPSLEESDPYPLTIDDGKHVYELGYASVQSLKDISDESDYMQILAAHVKAVDGKSDNVRDALLDIEDFGILSLMVQAIKKYFSTETYATYTCPECKKDFRVPLSAVEVTQFTPFLDQEAPGKYKVNFRL
jgi:DNA-directed RNA polymerase subunit RPC12/RpoP